MNVRLQIELFCPRLAAVLFAPVRFLAANHKGGPVEPQLRELVAMLQRLLLP